jgi:hypothetical protein
MRRWSQANQAQRQELGTATYAKKHPAINSIDPVVWIADEERTLSGMSMFRHPWKKKSSRSLRHERPSMI